jgi:diguanylate cyclase (GGDEF)-like protein
MEKIDIRNAAEIVEQLEEIDLAVVRWVAGEGEPPSEQRQWFDQLRQERGEGFYSDLIFTLLCRRYPQPEAHEIWDKIVFHRDTLSRTLGRNPGIVVAALDYLTNCGERPMEFRLIESGKLENMLERAVIDGLTGLYDHQTLLTLLEKEIERAKRHAETVSLLLLDLDGFKHINDTFGHQKGDEVLIRLAETIRQSIRTMDIAGRYGGEEFAIILPEAGIYAAIQSAERLRRAVEERFHQDLELTISVGIACFPDDGINVSALVRTADEALYSAKTQGKNRVVSREW